ncbi:hypothetical protein [Actinocrinis sp.]|uniref:hypothetical protein n=1 Tax=Actinocrinis sp. TaxID=1920516 RepID=UPI002C899DFD|nr:hypothetical protein [Actinocrinis sp.]HXR73538.1 hypothetical protein [Actinocrinis sp.]
MSRSKRFGAVAASAVICASTLSAVNAAPASASCAADVVVAVSGRYVFLWDGTTWWHDGPGGTITGTVQVTRTISSTLSYGADITMSDLINSVKASISNAATKSVATTKGHTYTHSIPATKYGNLKYGAWGYSVTWKKEYRHSNCTISVLGQGTGTVPTVATGWYYYNTNS